MAACARCGRALDMDERLLELLDCKLHFCLQCARGPLTEPPADHLPTHTGVLALARHLAPLAPAAPWSDAEDEAVLEARLLADDLEGLTARRRDYVMHVLDAVTALRLRLEAELGAPPAPCAAAAELDRLRARHAAALQQQRLDDAVRDAAAPLDFELLRLALAAPPLQRAASPGGHRDPVLFLANHCTAQLFTGAPAPPRSPSPLSLLPLVYLEVAVNGLPAGRVVIELRADAAPRMSRNFAALATGEGGASYRGCCVFRCWQDESVIAGDWELNDGRGGRSAFAESHFAPDESRLAAVRGAVGMRRSRRRRDRRGLVGSQFRIVLREMRVFSAIFGHVLEGLELVDRLSRTGDGAGKPRDLIVIADCGRLL